MSKTKWDRRHVLKAGIQAATAASVAAAMRGPRAYAQLPVREELEDKGVRIVTTTERNAWQTGKVCKPTFSWDMLDLNIDSKRTIDGAQAVQGFGACFNELGWTSLQTLDARDRESVMRELFHPEQGARFSYCRMPLGANDFSLAAYSYDETDNDFDLQKFSIDHDRKTLVPFIHEAKRQQPALRLWASPWTPPSWMKRNHFYAENPSRPGIKDNGIRPDQVGHEGEDCFIQEPRYFEAYAKYFGRFIDAYRAEGIDVGMVMPQNEFNSAQNFPSCTWTPEGLTRFLRDLGPEMGRRGVEIFFGTMERGNPKLFETVMADQEVARFIKGVGMQWAGKNALPAVHREFPKLAVFQSEQECGDGSNSWAYTSYCWHLMKHYLRNGASAYMYWNISLEQGVPSTWGWAQNSLVVVDARNKTYRYTSDYYLMKHLSHFVDIGALGLCVSGTCDNALAFRNPDGTIVALVRNEEERPQLLSVRADRRDIVVLLPANSIGTVEVK